MKGLNFTQINQWMSQSSMKSLEDAYQGALAIKAIEDQHFDGGPIAIESGKPKTVTDYFRTQLDRELLKVRSNLLRFRVTGFLSNRPTSALENQTDASDATKAATPRTWAIAQEAAILEKLAFIESVVGKYRVYNDLFGDLPNPLKDEPAITPEILEPEALDVTDEARQQLGDPPADNSALRRVEMTQSLPSKAKVKPMKARQTPAANRLFGGVSQIGKEFNPKYEQEVIQELRVRRSQNRAAIRWLAVLLIVPILVQVATKQLILNPLLGGYSDRDPSKVELSIEIEEEFLHEFSEFKETLELKALLVKSLAEKEKGKPYDESSQKKAEEVVARAIYGDNAAELLRTTLSKQVGSYEGLLLASESSPEAEAALEEEALQEKALELWRGARDEQLNGLKNVLADGAGLIAFVALVYFGRQKLLNVRSFSNRAFLSFNDPTKVFLFILITDMFVGFHSAEGWEVILEGVLHHFGLPESKVFINGFIATIPVIIDACVKFWIFSYLTRYSPSTSAIYERMNT